MKKNCNITVFFMFFFKRRAKKFYFDTLVEHGSLFKRGYTSDVFSTTTENI